MSQIFETYKNLILQTTLSLSLTLLLTFLKIPIFFLLGLHTYIHPENVATNNNNNNQNGLRPAIRRPSDSGQELKKRNKSKEKFEFDENNAQIFRLKLDDAHLQSRMYFKEYCNSFIYSFVALSCLLLYIYLDEDHDSGILSNGVVVVIVLGFVSLCKVLIVLARVSFEKSASKRSEKQLSVIIGVLGFLFGFLICSGVLSSVLDFDFGSIDGFGKFSIAVLMGCISGFLYMPSGKSARSFWLGTDQLRSNLEIFSCGWFGRTILYVNYLLIVFTALLWINPLAEMIVNKNVDSSKEANAAISLVGNVGLSPEDFAKLRLLCLLLSGVIQIVALRPNLQMYLNEAVLSWYQRLHASKVPDLDFSRAKVFLHNHFLCLVVMQLFAPPIMVLLLLGSTQIDGDSIGNFKLVCGLLPCSVFVQEVAVFLAWWVVFVWAVFTSASLLLYRRGILFIS
ncbi:hypothetical protein LWI28_019803 [Acer negundo]|uniref:Transmembrane protein 161B n=1 Tax=Acer negundo TaxID=4023 RepID=A0AAD5IF40_ACENE|nr:hypothetical protein LWI28_019803 [Acer negundo]KAK4839866.1 hypothetical protein QYF36_025589 [Acer negundo]